MVFDFFGGGGLEVGGGHSAVDGEFAGAGAAQGGEVGTAAEVLTDVVGVGANVEPLGAVDGKVNLGQGNAGDIVVGDVNGAGIAFYFLTFAGEFVERDAVFFDGGDHGGDLFEVADVFVEGGIDLLVSEGGDFFFFEDFTLFVLGVGGGAEGEGAGVFFVLGHKEILNFGGAADNKHE